MNNHRFTAQAGESSNLGASRQADRHGTVVAEASWSSQPQSQPPPRIQQKLLNEDVMRKRFDLLTRLLIDLEHVVMAEISALYYMECSLTRFLIRLVAILVFLDPRDDIPHMDFNISHALFIVIPNAWCIWVHLFSPLPVPQDYNRGYMHGGIILDFIGQKPPDHRVPYLLIDVLILGFQCFMLVLQVEREQLRLSLKTPDTPLGDTLTRRARTIEDLDAEEQNIQSIFDGAYDVELQPLTRSLSPSGDSTEDRSSLLISDRETSRDHVMDVFRSGNALLGEYHIVHSMLSMISTTWSANTSFIVRYRDTYAALQAQQRNLASISTAMRARR